MIEVSHLRKTFRVAKRNAGFSQAAKALFHKEYEEIHALEDGVLRIKPKSFQRATSALNY